MRIYQLITILSITYSKLLPTKTILEASESYLLHIHVHMYLLLHCTVQIITIIVAIKFLIVINYSRNYKSSPITRDRGDLDLYNNLLYRIFCN